MFPLITQPVTHLVSCDQPKEAVLFTIDDCFFLGKDGLSLLRAALITSDIIPIGMDESTTRDEEEGVEEKEEMKQQNGSSDKVSSPSLSSSSSSSFSSSISFLLSSSVEFQSGAFQLPFGSAATHSQNAALICQALALLYSSMLPIQ
ncbi:uncharacterized protein MONOS_167 [Monocercomonoides exilis]|uniref:uncharacterized protein n=1 Tax=Monocercomonoides exilis TaxID=2049356 RepID=UPI0035599A7F|nr:hypothetical protein MONOS_167 [Monocercomonoides exilis]|eukprot:MONOS_167.1-p1 / transcript=MONOS_167.1 / gene=MONOS_167 / organism=Monocercomonoides_exilis_PA203 / gene_product=unspecified product / transcript_product=unspecified product / location=Mono_scaffold00003:88941-89381(-) / protein_length=147 / sequence_SO=supercontig / SO=protein_coding / is_pseudo=false